jgi:hypothetical protein
LLNGPGGVNIIKNKEMSKRYHVMTTSTGKAVQRLALRLELKQQC